jgi:hypothetical protein
MQVGIEPVWASGGSALGMNFSAIVNSMEAASTPL